MDCISSLLCFSKASYHTSNLTLSVNMMSDNENKAVYRHYELFCLLMKIIAIFTEYQEIRVDLKKSIP